ncbi:MAG: T9SS type A sorting domain-containing protein [Bacteroidales bacterium]|nr:T9SS type A sorting domain-containing protein [Bacteroidales bacterium]
MKVINKCVFSSGTLYFSLSLIFLFVIPFGLYSQSRSEIAYDFECSCKKHAIFSEKQWDRLDNVVGLEYDLKYHRFNWNLRPDSIFISGSVFSIFEIKKQTQHIDFQLSEHMNVDSVKYHSKKIAFDHKSDNLVICKLPEFISIETVDSIEVFYHGSPNDQAAFNRHYHSHGSDSIPSLWTLSEPYGAQSWWPCKNHLSDKIDSTDFFITTPKPYRVAGSGLLVDETQNGNHITYHWKHRYPIPAYLIFLAVSEYSVFEEYFHYQNDSLLILNYVYPQDSAIAHDKVKALLPAMTMMSDLFGPYPFQNEKYGHVQMGRGGGMEHQTMTSMGSWSYEIVVHEAAHQWFGDYITCASWHDIWLNEAFATYISALAYERVSQTDFWWEKWKEVVTEKIVAEPGGSVYVADTTDVSRIFSGRLTYYKGAYVLHMLRWVLGDQKFFQAVQQYLNDPENSYGYATNLNFKSHLEHAYGGDLTWFFDQWYYGEGYPEYEIVVEQLNDEYVEVEINQNQSIESAHFFKMPVPIQFWSADKDTIIIFDHQYSGEVFTAKIGTVYDSVIFDPQRWILSANNTLVDIHINSRDEAFVFPNPSSGEFQLRFEAEKYTEVSIYNLKGKLMKTYSDPDIKSGKVKMDCTAFANGSYLVVLDGEGTRSTLKIVILK